MVADGWNEVARSNQVRTRLQPDFKLAHNDDRRGVFLALKVTSYFTYKSSVWVTLPPGRHGGQCTNTRLQFSLFFSYKSYSAFTTLSTAIHHPSIHPSLPAIHQMSPKHPIPEWQKSKAPIKTIKGVWEELEVERAAIEELLREAKVCPHCHFD